jgi:hypothetical protein
MVSPRLRRIPDIPILPELSIFPRDPDTVRQVKTPEQLQQDLWDLFRGKKLVWGKGAQAKLAHDVYSEAKKAMKDLKKDESESQPSGGAFGGAMQKITKEFLVDMGLNLPVLRQAKSVFKVISESAKAASTYLKKRTVGKASSSEQYAFEDIALTGLYNTLDEKLTRHCVKFGSYTYDVVTSFVDPIGLSGVPSSLARLAENLHYVHGSVQMVDEVNEKLASAESFDLSIFTRCPLLGCYLLNMMDTGTLVGMFDAFDLSELSAAERKVIIGRLSARDQTEIDELDKKYKRLKVLADDRIKASPYLLEP